MKLCSSDLQLQNNNNYIYPVYGDIFFYFAKRVLLDIISIIFGVEYVANDAVIDIILFYFTLFQSFNQKTLITLCFSSYLYNYMLYHGLKYTHIYTYIHIYYLFTYYL